MVKLGVSRISYDTEKTAAAFRHFKAKIRKLNLYRKVVKRSEVRLYEELWDALSKFEISLGKNETVEHAIDLIFDTALFPYLAVIKGDSSPWLGLLIDSGGAKELLLKSLGEVWYGLPED